MRTVLVLALVAGCGGDVCDGPPGLYTDADCSVVASDLVSYVPRYPLWSDGAEKERYVRLPSGQSIDTSVADDWVFPVGTTFYKTFSRDGLRLETRVLEKVGPDAWDMRAYAWDRSQRRAIDVTQSSAEVRENVLGTDHDIPDGSMCRQCHSGSRDAVNGYSAIQLGTVEVPGGEIERAALGYLHGNCSHCHRESTECTSLDCCRTSACVTGLFMQVRAADARVEDSGVYRTAIGRGSIYTLGGASCRVAAGDPDASVIALRMAARGSPDAMPRIGTEHVDPNALAAVRAWIASMSPGPGACDR
jgi:hypothetical protein